ncbi:DNA topology modulation protein FlaR [Lentibacillus sediminis]|uniref:DNA topology modulation protein FlaR n=1 Tax=Lentibacillus sediminis TaxID=1940529 RepID=UPI000C1BEFF1|nr:DNA topology modulation protein FlaR [Lentibacillus sediminis]
MPESGHYVEQILFELGFQGGFIIRIHIIGGSGSGKTYMASQLSKKFNIPHMDLDDIFWENSTDQYGVKASVSVRDNKLKNFVMQPSWVIEGVYLKWVIPSFELADKIFILKTPIQTQEERIWSRYHKRKMGILPSTKKETIESLKDLLEWNKKYNQEFLPDFVENTQFADKIIHLNGNDDIFNFMD